VTQCAVSPGGGIFDYEFVVDEEAGTYWYHTHSGVLGIDAADVVRGPLIVHSEKEEDEVERSIFDVLGNETTTAKGDLVDLLSRDDVDERYRLAYGNERILFFSDGKFISDALMVTAKMSGLDAPPSRNDDGFVVASQEWKFGTCNGRLREVVFVGAGEKYKFRLINGGQHFAYRISLGGLPLTIVAADSEPVNPVVADEVILHTAERFDVEVTIPQDAAVGDSWWIKADTLESTWQGYPNGIRAVLHVVDPSSLLLPPIGEGRKRKHLANIPDPAEPIERNTNLESLTTLNCYSSKLSEAAKTNGRGGCLPITYLRPNVSAKNKELPVAPASSVPPEVHTVDFEFSFPPQYAHFIRFNNGPWVQHVTPLKSMMDPSFDSSLDLHPHTQILHVKAFSTAIIIWRTSGSFDHPIHLHGYKMEVLEVVHPQRRREACTLLKCKLVDDFDPANSNSGDRLQRLLEKKPMGTAVLKDTFILPAGGAVVTRIVTQQPTLWFAHCHLENHREDGMAFILNVGNYEAPADGSWLPQDHPSCDTPFLKSQHSHPACNCYLREDAVLGIGLSDKHHCSREHLCHHKHSQVANLDNYFYEGGFFIASEYSTPQWGVSLIVSLCVFIMAGLVAKIPFTWCIRETRKHVGENNDQALESETNNNLNEILDGHVAANTDAARGIHEELQQEDSEVPSRILCGTSEGGNDISSASPRQCRSFDGDSNGNGACNPSDSKNSESLWRQFVHVFASEWQNYSPCAVNALRVVEVTGIAALTGLLFYTTGKDSSVLGLAQKTSLLFSGAPLWTFERMHMSLVADSYWIEDASKQLSKDQFKAIPLWLGRLSAVNLSEFFWPFIYVTVCHTMAGIAGDLSQLMKNGLLLALNNACYVSLGSMLGSVAPSLQYALIFSTIAGQTSLIAAGFFTDLPPVIEYFRYASPVFWCYKGILKGSYRWSDTFDCLRGSSDVGANQCFIENDLGIDQTKKRGIEVATFNNEQSEEIHVECLALVTIFWVLQLIILFRLWNGCTCISRHASQQ